MGMSGAPPPYPTTGSTSSARFEMAPNTNGANFATLLNEACKVMLQETNIFLVGGGHPPFFWGGKGNCEWRGAQQLFGLLIKSSLIVIRR